jgi:hypothetical protein
VTDELPTYDAVYVGPPAPPLPPPGAIAPPRGVLRAIAHKIGVHRMTLEQLREADLAMTPRAEVLARLGQPSSADPEVIRELDRLVDENEQDRSKLWTQPLDQDVVYHARIFATLQLAAEGLGMVKGGASMSPGSWQDLVDNSMAFVAAHRRRVLWGTPLPTYMIPVRDRS